MRQRRQRRARRPWPPPSPARASPGPLRGDPTSSLHPFSSLFSAFPSDRAESSNLAPAAAATACRDERFGKESHYEWSKDFSHFGHLLPVPLGVLEVGCGNSRLGEELLQEGVAGGITCVDLSPVAGQRMRDRLAAQGTKGVDVVVADMLDLPLEPWSFDLVVEKGTMASSLAKMVLSAQGPGDLFLPFGPEYLENMSINLDHPKLSGETTVQSAVTEVDAMVVENVKFRRGFMLSTTGRGAVSSYMHTCPQPGLGRIAGLVTLETEDSSALLDALKIVGSSIACILLQQSHYSYQKN